MIKTNANCRFRSGQTRRLRGQKNRWWLGVALMILAGFLIAACSTEAQPQAEPTSHEEPALGAEAVADTQPGEPVELPHVHGIGFSGDGKYLSVAAHDGLRIFTEGRWLDPETPRYDYMGYSVVDEGFYSSGHPAPDSSLRNPLGLVKSSDGGETLAQLAFEGESDFHVMDVGYYNHAIYVINPQPNSQLEPGLHYSLDDGESWQQAALGGITGQLIALAVHPSEANVVALATADGLFLSQNYGDDFVLVSSDGAATAAEFSPDGETLLFGYLTFFRYDLESEQIESLPTPAIASDDGIAYIAINPVDPTEMAFATFRRHIFRSDNGGQSWHPIALDGKGVAIE